MNRTPLEPWIAHRIGETKGAEGIVERAALERYQLQRLHDTLVLASTRSAFYRRALASVPTAIASRDEVRRLPFTTADDIRADPLAFVAVSQDAISRVVTLSSSGTTGRRKRLYFTPADQALTVDFFRIGMSVFTSPGDRVLILLPGETPGSVGDLLAVGLRELGAVPIKHGPVRDAEATLELAATERASVMVGVPTHLLRLARHRRVAAPLPDLHSILLSTDHVPGAVVAALEAAWGCRVYNHYGMTEMGLGGGVDCPARRGYHMREADFLFEIVDPQTGQQVDDGEPGELVFTTLTRTGMPLIRYRTGDVARWLPGPCPCGTSLRTLAHITTRTAGRVRLGATETVTQADLDEAVFAVGGVVDFAASVGPAGTMTTATLAIQAQVAPHARLDATRGGIERAVAAIPAVAAARASGVLTAVEVTVTRGPIAPPTPAKRAIAVVGTPSAVPAPLAAIPA